MNENPTTPPAAPVPRKLPVWAIVAIAFLVLCCCCVGAIGLIFAFWDPIIQALGLSACLPIVTML